MDPVSLVEFYIASNPPLQPNGVNQVMDWVKEWNVENEHRIIEILYEPSVPWFKVLTLAHWQAEVTDMVERWLSRLVDECRVAGRALGDPTNGLRVDTVSSFHTIPWAALSASQEDYEKAFDDYRYPEDMSTLLYKRTWTGLVAKKGYAIETLFELPDRWHQLGFPDSLESLKQLLGCYVSHNIGGTTLYLGSKAGEDTITKAVNTLNNLLQCAATTFDHLHHLIYDESEGKIKYVYRWLSHLGLLQTTYASGQDIKTEHRLLKSAATIRAAKKTKDIWVTDLTTYPYKGGIRLNMTKPFSAFNDYQYKSKEASAISGLVKEAQALILENQQVVQQGADPDLLTAREGNSAASNMGPAPTEGLPHGLILGTDISNRPSPRFPPRHASHDSLKSENLIFFDEDIGCSQDYSLSIKQPSLLDDCPPFEPMEIPPMSFTGTTPPSDVIHTQSERNDNQPLPKPSSQTHCPLPGCSMEKKISPSGHPRVEGETAKLLEERIKSLASVMQFAPGHATIRLKFGRFYMVNLSSAEVWVSSGPYRRSAEILANLESATLSGNLRFSTVLSTIGPDAEAIVGTSRPTPMWTKPVVQVMFQMTCTFKGETFFVEINADTLDYTCQGPVIELGSVLVHCPRHPWDMKVCGDCSKNLDTSAIHRLLGQIIVNSLHILPASNGDITLELTANEKLGLVIEGVAIRHAAKYLNTRTKDSNLSIVMTQKLLPGGERDCRRRWSVSKHQGNYGPKMWFEAYITSAGIEKVMQENPRLSVGGRSSWSSEDLLSQGLFSSLYEPALKMLPSLETIGEYNDNGQPSEGGLTFGDSLAEEDARKGPVDFW